MIRFNVLEVKKSYLQNPINPAEGCSLDSEYFYGVRYIVKDNHIVVTDSFGNGTLSIDFSKLDLFICELMDIPKKSKYFSEVKYIIVNNHLIISDECGNGTLSVKLKNIHQLISELMDIQEVYGEELS